MFRRVQCRVDSVNLRTQLRRLSESWIRPVAVLSLLAQTVAASPSYAFKVIAKSGDSPGGFTLNSFKPSPSINDIGRVAFIAQSADGGKAVFVAEPSGNAYLLTKLAETSSGEYGAVSINSNSQVAVSFRAVAGG